MKKSFILSLLICLCFASTAQNKIGKVSGFIKDEAGKPLPSVTVSLLKSKDSALAKTAVTDQSGKYEMDFIAAGTYVVSAGHVGYKKIYSSKIEISETATSVNVDDIQFGETTTNL